MFLVEMYECGQVPQVKYFADKQQAQRMCGAEAEEIAEENHGKWNWLDEKTLVVLDTNGEELMSFKLLGVSAEIQFS